MQSCRRESSQNPLVFSREVGIELNTGTRNSGMLFADDVVGVSDSENQLRMLIDVVYAYCCKWRLTYVKVIFDKDALDGSWRWGGHTFPIASKYTYLISSTMGFGICTLGRYLIMAEGKSVSYIVFLVMVRTVWMITD